MSTIKIQIKDYLAEYMLSKFRLEKGSKLIKIPKEYDLHGLIHLSLLSDSNIPPAKTGNLEIVVDSEFEYNAMMLKQTLAIRQRIRAMFWSECEYFMRVNRSACRTYREMACFFLKKYEIESLSEDAVIKFYFRFNKKKQLKINKL